MKRSTKRLISLLICLAMALAILPVAAFAAGTTKVYCQAPNGWTNCNAYWWGSSSGNPDWPGNAMEQDADGIWYYEVPSDATGLIFNNGSGTQTADLTVPTDDKTMYVFSNRVWELPIGPVPEVVEYFVAGSAGLCGVDWNPSAAENKLTKSDDVYTITYTDVPAGDYEFKVTNGTWDLAWGKDADSAAGAPNMVVNLTEATNTVQILFNPDVPSLEVVINAPALDSEETLIADTSVTFATADDAWSAEAVEFVPAADGMVTVDVTACNPGFYLDVWADGEWIEEYYETDPKAIAISVSAGVTYEFIVTAAEIYFPGMGSPAAGSVTYKITSDVPAGEPNQGGNNPGEGGGNSQQNPMPVPAFGTSIGAGETIWFIYDNTEQMQKDGVYSMMLKINAAVPYSASYREMEIPVDEEGFVNYEMHDMQKQGTYVFSITNNGTVSAFFSIAVENRPVYVISEFTLVLGDNEVVPDTDYTNTLYEFIPGQTGIFRFTISEGGIGNWGNIINPIDITGTSNTVLQWTCTDENQSIAIGVADTEDAILTVEKIGEYVPEDVVDETVYTNEYGFTYQLPENPELIKIDVLDEKADVAVLDKDGFYRYGSQYGPLVVTDLNEFPVNLADAYINGQLRAYICDNDGKVTAKYDYNEAMNEYLEAGLVPVTEELAMMLKQLGDQHGWWQANGFVFEGEAPEDSSIAWMTACSYIKDSELEPDADDNNGGSNSGNNSGNDTGNNSGNSNPKTADISMAWAMIVILLAGTCLVILKKKEAFFLN